MTELELKKTANEVRKNIVTAVYHAHSGHPGGSLSAADILTYLYFEEMNVEPKDPRKADRDRFVLSKGHAAPGLYSALAERGYIDKEELKDEYEGKIASGIVMLYFGLIVDTTLMDSKWVFDASGYEVPAEYRVVGYCNI